MVYAAVYHAQILVHVKIPCPTFDKRMAGDMETRRYHFSRIIKMMITFERRSCIGLWHDKTDGKGIWMDCSRNTVMHSCTRKFVEPWEEEEKPGLCFYKKCVMLCAYGVHFCVVFTCLTNIMFPSQPWHNAYSATLDSDIRRKSGAFTQTYAAFLCCAWHQPAHHIWRLWQTSHGHRHREPGM